MSETACCFLNEADPDSSRSSATKQLPMILPCMRSTNLAHLLLLLLMQMLLLLLIHVLLLIQLLLLLSIQVLLLTQLLLLLL